MKIFSKLLVMAGVLSIATSVFAAPMDMRVTVSKGTPINLVFDQKVSSKTAHVGDTIRLHVQDNVAIGDMTVIRAGTPVTGVLSEVKHKQRWGVNAKLMIHLNSVRSISGKLIPIDHQNSGARFSGKKSEEAAGTAAGGAILLGPVGLVGGYFVTGKNVVIHPGDPLPTEVARDTVVRHHMK